MMEKAQDPLFVLLLYVYHLMAERTVLTVLFGIKDIFCPYYRLSTH